jgi:basic amino acid/polyamine antiporter, APA family
MLNENNNENKLVAAITLPMAIAMIISSIIGSGVYKKVAPMTDTLQSPMLVLLAWVLGGLISLAGAVSNAEVASVLAGTGGEFRYYRTIYGRFFAFLFGWTTFSIIKTGAIASIAYVFTQSLNAIVPIPPLLESWADWNLLGVFKPFENFSIKLVTISLIAILSFINIRGIKMGGEISRIITFTVLIGIGIIVIFGLSSGQSDWARLSVNASNYQAPATWPLISSMFTAMLAAFWAYEGWNTIGYIGGEIQNPKRNLPIVLFWGVMAVITVYLLANVTYLTLLPADQLIAIKNTPNSIAAVEAVKSFWGAKGGIFISVLILITTLGCTHTTILLTARNHFAMANQGLFFKGVEKVHPKYATPANSLIYQGVWSCLLVFSGSFDQLTDRLIFAAFIFYGATTLGVFILRRKMPDAPRPYKVWGYPFVPAIFILFCVGLVINTIVSHPLDAGIGLGLIALGIPFFLYWNGKNGGREEG